jgi:hypothetical protein
MKTVLAVLLLVSTAHAEDESQAWVDRAIAHYKHMKVERVSSGLRQFAPCNLEARFKFEPWTAWMKVQHSDEKQFFAKARIGVRKMAPGVDAMALWEEAKKQECMASYAFEAVVQSGQYLFRLDAPCTQRQSLFPPAVADLIAFAKTAGGEPPKRVVYDVCGNPEITFMTVEEVQRKAAKHP